MDSKALSLWPPRLPHEFNLLENDREEMIMQVTQCMLFAKFTAQLLARALECVCFLQFNFRCDSCTTAK